MTGRSSVPPSLPPLGPRPVVSVVMPLRTAAAAAPRAVEAALAQVPPVDEVVLSVSPDDSATVEVARRLERDHDRIRVVDNPTGHTPDGLNAAIAAATGEVLVRVDAQAILPPAYVKTALGALRATGAANVGGLQVPAATTGFGRAVAAAMRSPFGAGGAAYRSATHPGPVDTVYLGVFRRAALDAVGGFDRRFRRNQDAELNRRLTEAGYTVWLEPSMAVAYTPRDTVAGLVSQYWQYGRWRRLNVRVHSGSLRPRQLAAPVLVVGLTGAAVLSALRGTPFPVLAAAGGYAAALVVAGAIASDRAKDILPTALALATMHLSWGVGFLVGPPRTTGPSSLSPVDADG